MPSIPGVRVGTAPRVGAPSLPERRLVGETLGVVRRHLGLEVAVVRRVVGRYSIVEHVDAVAGCPPVAVGAPEPLEATISGRVLDGRLPGHLADAGAEPALADLAATWSHPVGTHLTVPIDTGDGVYGTLSCFSRTFVPDVTAADLLTLRVFADIVGTQLRPLRDRAHQAVVEQARHGDLLDQGGPRMALQPIVDLADRTVSGFEALARFPSRPGWGPPDWFRSADQVGLGVAMEAAAVHNALQLLPLLDDRQTLSLNVSARALLASASIPAMLTGPAGERLVVEVTEHEPIPDVRRLNACLALLRGAGVRVAVDDAGSGYAGLQHILSLAPEVLKLDRTLITGIAGHAARRAMCAAMVTYARRTGTVLVAEGVETAEDLAVLEALGVTHAQGYLLGRPRVRAVPRRPEEPGREPAAVPVPRSGGSTSMARPEAASG